MSDPTTKSEIDMGFLRACLKDAGQMALGQRGQMAAAIKSDRTPVTIVDKQVEDFLIDKINKRYPHHQILSEESGFYPGSVDFTWVIDPIDGTRAFASGLPIWGVSIGVLRGSEPETGGFYMPVTGEMYWATRTQAFYNDQPISRIEAVDLDSPLVFLGVPSDFHLHFTVTYPRIRSLGSTAAQLAYVATGAAVGSLCRSFGLWDIAGMLPLLSAAGVEIVNLAGEHFRPADMLDGGNAKEPLLAASPTVLDQLRNNIRSR
jgi:myo-inositol-1(or 4)-monophosphatase